MKHTLLFISVLLIGLPRTVAATVSASPEGSATAAAPVVFPAEQTVARRGFVERVAKMTLIKRLQKIGRRSGYSDGRWLAISGLTLSLLGAGALVFILSTGPYLSLILGLAGLGLSIWALIKASSWEDTRLIRWLAIAGIVISASYVFAIAIVALTSGF